MLDAMTRRKLKNIAILIGFELIIITVLVSILIFGGNIPHGLRWAFVSFLVALSSLPYLLFPRHVSILGPGVVEALIGPRRLRISGRVVKTLTTREVVQLVYFCPIGWRVSFDYSFYGICSSEAGGVTVISTPGCSGMWLMIESGRKRYLVCCEERDGDKCYA